WHKTRRVADPLRHLRASRRSVVGGVVRAFACAVRDYPGVVVRPGAIGQAEQQDQKNRQGESDLNEALAGLITPSGLASFCHTQPHAPARPVRRSSAWSIEAVVRTCGNTEN